MAETERTNGHPRRKEKTQKTRKPTKEEGAARERYLDRQKSKPPTPRFKVKQTDSETRIQADHPIPGCAQALLADALCTGDIMFADGLLSQMVKASHTGEQPTDREINFMLSTIHAIGPRDPTEALLATQMAAIHNATMTAARRLNHVETLQQQDSASNMLNKLARTFTTQVETLKKYRSTGEQNIRVQHVNVSASQAVVGINQGEGGDNEKPNQSDAPSASGQSGSAMLSHEQAIQMSMPGTGREREVCMPDARSPRRRTDRPT